MIGVCHFAAILLPEIDISKNGQFVPGINLQLMILFQNGLKRVCAVQLSIV